MPYFVYILYGTKNKRLYVGCTSNLDKRLKRHNKGGVPTTQDFGLLDLIYSEKFENKNEAFNRERFLKSLWSASLKNKILKEYLQNRA